MAKEGTDANTDQLKTEKLKEIVKTYNEFSDLSVDYTIQEFEFEKANNQLSVKERLQKYLIFQQETISAKSALLEIIGNGHKIPFFKTTSFQLALKDKDFLKESISELLKCGSIIEVEKPAEVINLLSVAINLQVKSVLFYI